MITRGVALSGAAGADAAGAGAAGAGAEGEGWVAAGGVEAGGALGVGALPGAGAGADLCFEQPERHAARQRRKRERGFTAGISRRRRMGARAKMGSEAS